MTESVAPTVAGNNPFSPQDGEDSVSVLANLVIIFSESMDPDTVTTNTGSGNTSCSGTIQLSKTDFSNCVAMNASSPVASVGNTTFTLDPIGTLSKNQTLYKIRITTGVKDTSGNKLSVQIEKSFTTIQ